jgi:integrative and conjugative element protein (TIGR02256 family)
MADAYLPADGYIITPESLTLQPAKEVASFLLRGLHRYARFIETRALEVAGKRSETVIIEVEVESSQLSVVDIHPIERIGITFTEGDNAWPEVLALREDFPRVSHLNLRAKEYPRSLCLYERPYEENRSRWAPVSIVERVRSWLADTANGSLHKSDQPLEQLFLGTRDAIVLPESFRASPGTGPHRLSIAHADLRPWGHLFFANRINETGQSPGRPFLATTFITPPIMHGVLRWIPQALSELQSVCSDAGGDLLSNLRNEISTWDRGPNTLNSHLVLIVVFPKVRTEASPVESYETWVYVSNDSIRVIGQALGIWEMTNGVAGHIIGGVVDREALTELGIYPLNPTYALGRDGAATMNGVAPEVTRFTAVGLGALGSQVVTLLARSGFGLWSLIDSDVLLPHNVSRHQLTSDFVGFPKVEAMRQYLNRLLATQSVERAVFANVLEAGDLQTEIDIAINSSAAILDFSASVPVARYLARRTPKAVRCLSSFMNPSGTTLIMLAEDRDRTLRLNHLEMQYYRAVLNMPELAGHLSQGKVSTRYARSCRDVTATIPAHRVGLHAALCASAMRAALQLDTAQIKLWVAQDDGNVQVTEICPRTTMEYGIGDWTLVVDDGFIEKLRSLRNGSLPRETGGVLLGIWDLDEKTVYVVDTIPAPPDSKKRMTSFIRGSEGLIEQVRSSVSATAEMVQYIGEWHSHPDGYATEPSDDDAEVFSWIAERTELNGFQAVMAIVGEQGERWIVGSMPERRALHMGGD